MQVYDSNNMYCQSCEKLKNNVIKLVCCEDWACLDCISFTGDDIQLSFHAKYHCRGNLHSYYKQCDKEKKTKTVVQSIFFN